MDTKDMMQKGNDFLNGLLRKKKGKQPSLRMMFERRREQSMRMRMLPRRQKQEQSQRTMHSEGRDQSWMRAHVLAPELRSSGDDMDAQKPPPPPMVKKYWGNFSVTSEKKIEPLTEPFVELAFRDILLFTPEGDCDPFGAGLYGCRLRAIRAPHGGDSLLHALSIGALGCLDHEEYLRMELRILLRDNSQEPALLEAYHQGRLRQNTERYSDLENDSSGDILTSLEYRDMKSAGISSDAYLSGFHVFLMANVLRRPIIVYGEKAPFDADRDTGIPGVYLPTLHPEWNCTKNPLAVVYCVSSSGTDHFTGLVGTQDGLQRLPLFYRDGDDLPLRFGVPAASPRPLAKNSELFAYLNVSEHRSEKREVRRLFLMAEILETPPSPRVKVAPPVVPGRPEVANSAGRRWPVPGQIRNGDQHELCGQPRGPPRYFCSLRPEDVPTQPMSPVPSCRPKKRGDDGCGILLRRLFCFLQGPRILRRKSARAKHGIRGE